MSVVAVIFDYDDTLLPDSTSALLASKGIDPHEFWTVRAKGLIDQGYDQPMAYLKLMLDEVRDGQLSGLTNEELREFGSTLDTTWFAGLPELFDDLRGDVAKYRDVSIEFYIISGGLQSVVEGSPNVQKYFSGVYGCQLGEDPQTGVIDSIKRCVTFTEKTRFLFEINKGISQADAAKNPYLVNRLVEEPDRAVPIRNMIYVGDGLTDIPCFSVVEKGNGTAFGVLKPGEQSAKQAFQELVATRRVKSMHSPDYKPDGDLGAMLRAAVGNVCGSILLSRSRAV